MSVSVQAPPRSGPDWVIAEMPPGYQNRLEEIRRLSADLETMGRFGRLLWQIGAPLAEIVLDLFTALKFDAGLLPDPSPSPVMVKLDGRRRLLLYVSATEDTIQKKGPELTHVFQLLQELADTDDRVVLVTNSDPETRPADRTASMTAEALTFLSRMGVAHVTAATLFALWKQSLQDPDRARTLVERLHAQDGGTFQLPPL